jgi:hypothetical protein
MNDQTYRRSQVEWALWKFSTLDLPSGDEPISTFRARVKHLLQLDRAGVIFTTAKHPPCVDHALSSQQTEGTGIDAAFTAFDAFCLALAVDFLRAGFKQSEVLLLLGHLRPRLSGPFNEIVSAGAAPAFRSRLDRRSGGAEEAGKDRRVFLVVERVEFSEAFPAFAALGKGQKGGIFREPSFCYGIDALRDKLDKMDHLFRRAIVFEIAQMARRIAAFLDEAPLKKRGRPSGREEMTYHAQ